MVKYDNTTKPTTPKGSATCLKNGTIKILFAELLAT